MSYPPHVPPPPPPAGGLRPWHVMTAGLVLFVLVVGGALVFALTHTGESDTARADMETRWDELDRQTRIQTCEDHGENPDMVVTVFVEAFEERADRRGEDITVSREVAAEFLTEVCG